LDEEPSIHKRARAKNLQRLAHAFRHSSPQPKFASGSLSDKPPIISELKLTRNFCHAGVGVTLARGLLGFEMLPGAWAWQQLSRFIVAGVFWESADISFSGLSAGG
jgi:hypothetical protein